MSRSKQEDKRWKVPTPIKVAIGIIGAFFILMAVIGSVVHGQENVTAGTNATEPSTIGIPESAKGCIGNDQTTGKTYIDLRCLRDPQINQVMCDNWPSAGVSGSCPSINQFVGINGTSGGATVPYNATNMIPSPTKNRVPSCGDCNATR